MPIATIENRTQVDVVSHRSVADVILPTYSLLLDQGMLNLPEYQGPYTITPTDSEQVFNAIGTVMNAVITVEPIPSNWGLITWDGTVITVS